MMTWVPLAAVLLTGMGWQGTPPDVQIRAVRMYRPGQQTYVRTFVQIPVGAFANAGKGRVTYEVSLGVKDSSGLVLKQEQWWGHATVAPGQPEASAMEMIEFSVAPGQYRVVVTATDSVSGRSFTGESAIAGFTEVPLASDLVLSPMIRRTSVQDTMPKSGEWCYGGKVMITGATSLVLTPNRSRTFYLLEAYSSAPDSGTMTVTLADSTGHEMLRTRPANVRVDAGGGLLKGDLDLAGLPAGAYTFSVALSLGDRTVQRSGTLSMMGLEETLAHESAARAAVPGTDEAYFSAMSDAELDAAEAPLVYIAEAGELAVYSEDLSASAKARFLTEFWRKRGPAGAAGGNPARERFYGLIAYANEHYREAGRGTVPGWRSDRGRIYLKYGAPDELIRREREGPTPPLEVWKYSKGRNRYFVFADRNGIGAYNLLTSNDLKEPGMPNWQSVVGVYGMRALSEYITGISSTAPAGTNRTGP
jgi:GWxTD domain-containing protein